MQKQERNLIRGPRFGVTEAETSNGKTYYLATLFDTVTGNPINISAKRQTYGEAFAEAYEWSRKLHH